MRYLIAHLCLALILTASIPTSAEAEQHRLPDMSGYTLDGHRRSLPAALSAPATLLVVTLDNPGSEQAASWHTLSGAIGNDIPVLFIVLMDDRGPRARAFAAGRLRGKVREPAQRASTIAIFSDVDQFYRMAGLAEHSDMVALLVSDDGTIIGRSLDPDAQAAQAELAEALEDWQTEPRLHKISVPPAPAPDPEGSPLSPASPSQPTHKPAERIQADESPAPHAGSVPVANTNWMFPELSGYTLSGDRIVLPDDVISENTRLYVIRRGRGSSNVSADVLAIAEIQGADDNWLALIFMGKSPIPSKAFAAGSLRNQIDAKLRSHVVPIFSDLATLEDTLDLGLLSATPAICINARGALCTEATAD